MPTTRGAPRARTLDLSDKQSSSIRRVLPAVVQGFERTVHPSPICCNSLPSESLRGASPGAPRSRQRTNRGVWGVETLRVRRLGQRNRDLCSKTRRRQGAMWTPFFQVPTVQRLMAGSPGWHSRCSRTAVSGASGQVQGSADAEPTSRQRRYGRFRELDSARASSADELTPGALPCSPARTSALGARVRVVNRSQHQRAIGPVEVQPVSRGLRCCAGVMDDPMRHVCNTNVRSARLRIACSRGHTVSTIGLGYSGMTIRRFRLTAGRQTPSVPACAPRFTNDR